MVTMPKTPGGYTLQQAQSDIADVKGSVNHVAANPAKALAQDTWHSVSVSVWSGTLYYKLTFDNEVYLYGSLTTPASGVNGTAIATLGSGYSPAHNVSFNGTHTGTTNFEESFTLSTTGGLTPSGFGTSASVYIGPIRIPLDIP